MAAVFLMSVLFWVGPRDRVPAEIKIATGRKGGQYYAFGLLLAQTLEARDPNLSVEVVATDGSRENVDRLLIDEDVDLAILQGGSVDISGFGDVARPVIVAPLYPDIMHVIVRKGIGITNITNLKGRRVNVGGLKSGMRQSAQFLLQQYDILGDVVEAESNYFDSLPGDQTIDAAIVTSGVRNSDLRRILRTGDYELLPITDASAMEISDPYFREFQIPKGLFREQPPVPAEQVKTIATTALMVTRGGASELLIQEILEAVYEEGMRLQFPTMHSRDEAKQWLDLPMHPVARRYFDPQDEIGHMAAVMESLAATKELLFALAAGIYLIWERWRRLREKEEKAELNEQKSRLDELLTRTVEIEARQIEEADEAVLKQMLDDVTRIKLRALDELTHQELRGDRSFLIFLTQCSNLIAKIQVKIANIQAHRGRQKLLAVVGAAAGAMVFLFRGRRSSGGELSEH